MKEIKINQWPLEAKTGLVLTLAATLIIGGTLLFGNASVDKPNNNISTNTEVENVPSNEPVTEQIEEFIRPFNVKAIAERLYYDMSDDLDSRAKAIVVVPNKKNTYMKSVGVDYTYQSTQFDVIASASGTVVDRITDSVYGNMLCIEHDSGLKTIYASLGDFNVTKGSKVKQGTVIGKSGESLYTSGLGSSLHFEVIKDGININPEKIFNLKINKI